MMLALCPAHHAAMLAAIDRRGLLALVTPDAQDIKRKAFDIRDHGLSVDNYDPYFLGLCLMIGRAARVIGAEVVVNQPPCCPVCFMNRRPETPPGATCESWIEDAATYAAERWEGLKL